MKPKFRILSIDGGGLRGIIPLQVIKKIEKITNQPIHKTFDLIAGTSTGGLLTCALLLRDNSSCEANKRKYTLDQIEEIYLKKGKTIFPRYKHLRWLFVHIKKWIYPKYAGKNLEKVLREYFADYKINNCLKPIFITSFDISKNTHVFFTYREALLEYKKNPYLVDICRATSAAPTYFQTYTFFYPTEKIVCIDGGLIMNNPSMGAFFEVLGNTSFKLYQMGGDKIEIKDIAILSLGTGYTEKLCNSVYNRNWGRLQWIKKIIDIALGAPSIIIDEQLESTFREMGLRSNYLRLNVKIDEKYAEMDDSREEALNHYLEKASEITNDLNKIEKLKLFLENCGVKIPDY